MSLLFRENVWTKLVLPLITFALKLMFWNTQLLAILLSTCFFTCSTNKSSCLLGKANLYFRRVKKFVSCMFWRARKQNNWVLRRKLKKTCWVLQYQFIYFFKEIFSTWNTRSDAVSFMYLFFSVEKQLWTHHKISATTFVLFQVKHLSLWGLHLI